MRLEMQRSGCVATRSSLGMLLGTALIAASARADSPKPLSPGEFAAEVGGLRQLVQACARETGACEAARVPPRQEVTGAAAGSFQVDWSWLATSVSSAKTASAQDRAAEMRSALAHLDAIQGEAADRTPATTPAVFAKARSAANAALARDEFRTSTEGPSWWDKQLARLQDGFLRLFTGMGRVGERAPWLAPLIEWVCFGVAASGLLWFVRQSLQRQALRLAFTDAMPLAGHGERASADWARLAQEHASREDWREAVHCLYWAAIALMESRRAWKPNVTRTPREYLALLRAGSDAEQALRRLTREFERVWYGAATGHEGQYRAALASYQALEASRPERAPGGGEPATPLPHTAAAAGGV